jgi:hypothetical protein
MRPPAPSVPGDRRSVDGLLAVDEDEGGDDADAEDQAEDDPDDPVAPAHIERAG